MPPTRLSGLSSFIVASILFVPGIARAASHVYDAETAAPQDIILIADNSGSMGTELVALQNALPGFWAILLANGLDARLIAVSRHGENADESICIAAPISGSSCFPVPGAPATTSAFLHYSVEVGSRDPWCLLEDSFSVPDEFGLYPIGLSSELRPAADKVAIAVSDDRINCMGAGGTYDDGDSVITAPGAADLFAASLFALEPTQFGSAAAPNLRYHSIVGIASKPVSSDSYGPLEALEPANCSGSVNAGLGHQALSTATDGLRFPICNTNDYDVFLQEVATEIVADSAATLCDYDLADTGAFAAIDTTTLALELDFDDPGSPLGYAQVPDELACTPASFFLQGSVMRLCSDACSAAQGLPGPLTMDATFLLLPGTDPDGDGIPSEEEEAAGTDPLNADSDGDLLDDGEELLYGSDPLDPDTDDDTILDGDDLCLFDPGTDPNDRDADRVGDSCDNCQGVRNPSQADSGGLATATPDGVGDACQNGDFDGNGIVDTIDMTLGRRALVGLDPPIAIEVTGEP